MCTTQLWKLDRQLDRADTALQKTPAQLLLTLLLERFLVGLGQQVQLGKFINRARGCFTDRIKKSTYHQNVLALTTRRMACEHFGTGDSIRSQAINNMVAIGERASLRDPSVEPDVTGLIGTALI
jgi:hypothetical protein